MELVEFYEVIYVGYPLNLSGSETISTVQAIDFAQRIETETGIPVRLIDERLTTKSAATLMKTAGRSSKEQRKRIDAIAAFLILEQAAKLETVNGKFAGYSISEVSPCD